MNSHEAGSSNLDTERPAIYKLNPDCFDEIFNYLSVKKLQRFGETSTRMQAVAGNYFKNNYSAAFNTLDFDGVHTTYFEEDCVIGRTHRSEKFNRFITNFTLSYNTHPLKYVNTNIKDFTSINRINLKNITCFEVNEIHTELLPTLKTLHLENIETIGGEINEFLTKCVELKRLSFRNSINGYKWLSHSYKVLEHLEFMYGYTVIPKSTKEALDTSFFNFFEKNPNLKTFSTSSYFLFTNSKLFLELTAKIEKLEIMIETHRISMFDYASFHRLLKCLYEKEFYKEVQLHFIFCGEKDELEFRRLASLNGLTGFGISVGIEHIYKQLGRFTELSQLTLDYEPSINCADTLAKELTVLTDLYINNATTIDSLLPFIRHSMNLSKLKVMPECGKRFNCGSFKLSQLNAERQKLSGAKKLVFYTRDDVFEVMKLKTENGETKLTKIEMRRADSKEWELRFFDH